MTYRRCAPVAPIGRGRRNCELMLCDDVCVRGGAAMRRSGRRERRGAEGGRAEADCEVRRLHVSVHVAARRGAAGVRHTNGWKGGREALRALCHAAPGLPAASAAPPGARGAGGRQARRARGEAAVAGAALVVVRTALDVSQVKHAGSPSLRSSDSVRPTRCGGARCSARGQRRALRATTEAAAAPPRPGRRRSARAPALR